MILHPFLLQEIEKESINYVDTYISDYQDQFHKISISNKRLVRISIHYDRGNHIYFIRVAC